MALLILAAEADSRPAAATILFADLVGSMSQGEQLVPDVFESRPSGEGSAPPYHWPVRGVAQR